MAQSSYLRNKITGVVFVATDALRRMEHMEPCNYDGSPYVQFVGEDDVVDEEAAPVPTAPISDPVLTNR